MDDIMVTLVGNLTAEPMTGQTAAGEAWTTFRVAHTPRVRDRTTNQWTDGETNFLRVSCFRGLAANAAASFGKGDRVFVQGRLRLKPWERNGKQGLNAQVEARALGHDLTWGSSTFTRAGRDGAERSTMDAEFDELETVSQLGEETIALGDLPEAPEDYHPDQDAVSAPGSQDGSQDGSHDEPPWAVGTPAVASGTESFEQPVSTVSAVGSQAEAPEAERALVGSGSGRGRRR